MGAKTIAIKAIISAVDKISGPVNRIAAVLRGRLGGAFGTVLRGVKAAAAKLTEWTVTGAKVAAAGAIALAGAVALATKSYIDHASALADVTSEVGFGVGALQELRYGFGLVGVSAEEVDASLSAFAINVGRARAGTGRFAAFLTKVSPALLKQVKAAKSNEQAFDLVFQALTQIPDASRRAALAASAFGGAGPKIARLAGEGAEGLRKLREEFRATGAGLTSEEVAAADKLGDDLDRLKLRVQGVANALLGRLIPVLQPLVERLMAWLDANRELIRTKIADAVKRLADVIKGIDWTGLLRKAGEFLQWARDAFDAIGGVSGALKILGTFLAINTVANLASATAGAWRFVAAMRAAALLPAIGGAASGVAGAVGGAASGVAGAVGGAASGAGLAAAATGAAGALAVAAPIAMVGGVLAVGVERSQGKLADQTVGAVERRKGRTSALSMNPDDYAERRSLSTAFLTAPAAPAPQGQVVVRFENAPPGMRAAVDGNGLIVAPNVGRRNTEVPR